jgi:hypothetical protein
MFTGLIADLGTVSALELDEQGATLRIESPLARELQEGDSIAVNGVCLTATKVELGSFAAQAMQETLRRTSRCAPRVGWAGMWSKVMSTGRARCSALARTASRAFLRLRSIRA